MPSSLALPKGPTSTLHVKLLLADCCLNTHSYPCVFLFRGWSPAAQLQPCCSQGLEILVTPHLFPLEGGVCHLLFFSFSNSLVFCQLAFFHECLDVLSLLIVFVLHSCSSSPLLDLFFVPLFLSFRAKEKPEALQIISTHILVCTLV